MNPPRLLDRVLARAVGDREVAESIRGDLYDECRRRPPALRGAWYAWHVSWIAAGYFAARAVGRAPRRARGAARCALTAGWDLRHAPRMWRRRPGFTALTVITLGLGIGATTAIVTVVDRVMLRPLPYPDAHELVTVWNTFPAWRGHEVLDPYWDEVHLSYPEYRDWRDGQTAFRQVAIYSTGPATLTGVGDPALIGLGTASSTLFPLLGARPQRGRTFSADEEGAGGDRVAVVSHRFWMGRLGGVADPVGRPLTIDGERYLVIGVLAEGFRVRSHDGLPAQTPDVWVPAGLFGDADDRGQHRYEAIARLRPGTSIAQAEADAGPLLRGGADPSRMGVRVLPRQREEVASARGLLIVLLLAAAVLMAIAGVNVATLFAAETSQRRHELATRRTLGASRWQLARQLAVESGSIGLLGAVVGTTIAVAGVPALLALAPAELELPRQIPLAVRILVATALFGVVVGIAFGVVPSLLASRSPAGSALHARTVTSHRAAARVQRGLIAIEAALCIVLLVGAGLLARTLLAMEAVDPGFRRENLVAINLPLSGPQTQPHLVSRLARDLIDRIGALPGVSAVTGANTVPFADEGTSSSFTIEGRPVADGEKWPEAHRRSVLPGFHEVLDIAVVAGRGIRGTDVEDSHAVVVVSESLAERYWPDRSPIGEFIVRDDRRWEIVGVVRDILHADLTERTQSTFYFPFYQQPPNRFWMLVRSAVPADDLLPAIRRTVADMAPSVALGRVDALGRFVDESTGAARYRAALVAVFGGCSLLLAAVGIFGVTARMVAARRRELGLRAALGARRSVITRTVMATEAWAIGAGIAAGLVLSAVAVRALQAFLFGVSPYDATSFVQAAAVLAAVGLGASYLPARRTSNADPMEVLRVE